VNSGSSKSAFSPLRGKQHGKHCGLFLYSLSRTFLPDTGSRLLRDGSGHLLCFTCSPSTDTSPLMENCQKKGIGISLHHRCDCSSYRPFLPERLGCRGPHLRHRNRIACRERQWGYFTTIITAWSAPCQRIMLGVASVSA